MSNRLRGRLRLPVIGAPMAGGPSNPELVLAVTEAGGLGFLAAGYKTPAAMADEMEAVRRGTGEAFGVNLFVPGAPTSRPADVARYLASVRADADELGVVLGEPEWDDDGWDEKLAALLAAPVPVVSFTFGCPAAEVVGALAGAGTAVGVTVTSAAEAAVAAAAGVDFLCVQGAEAGAHRGTFADAGGGIAGPSLRALLGEVGAVTDLPLVAAGGLMDGSDVAAARAAGALAVQCGTAFLRCPESGTHPTHRAVLGDPRSTSTAATRAFSGRPARALVNGFLRAHDDAPAAYPEVNNALRPLRAAAAVAGDADRIALWAGTGFGRATDRSAGEVVALLCGSGR